MSEEDWASKTLPIKRESWTDPKKTLPTRNKSSFSSPVLCAVLACGDVAGDVPEDAAAVLHDLDRLVLQQHDQELQGAVDRANIGLDEEEKKSLPTIEQENTIGLPQKREACLLNHQNLSDFFAPA